MLKNSMSLKAKINNIAKAENISPQAVMQTYMLERLLERISKSQYNNNFILKGGMLVSSIIGIDSRTTMDMDTTIKGFKLDKENLTRIINEIIKIDIDDNIKFELLKIENIRENDSYGGLRVHINASFDNMPIDLKIDITTGDVITYNEIKYKYNLLLENRTINIWTYNIESILAEKYESIIKRSILNTRIRDFYDVFILIHLDKNNISDEILKEAIKETSLHRDSFNIINDKILVEEVIESISTDRDLIKQWNIYKKKYDYAKGIEYDSVIESIIKIKNIYFN